jgi:hypothetical protein
MNRKGIILLPVLLVSLAIGGIVVSLVPPHVTNIKELAKYADCQPENIREWLNDYYAYDNNFNAIFGNDGDEPTGDMCIARKTGNCRCFAAISQDTLNQCRGYSAHTACMRSGLTEAHCLTYFTGPKGVRGFINSGAQAETYPAGTDWAYIEGQVSGGPWVTP